MSVKKDLEGVMAVVLTFRRERLASQVVRSLIANEGFDPDDIIVVVNGEGGLDDPRLTSDVHIVQLPQNVGPAGGFRAGLEAATRRGATWAYLCEDDIGLFQLPSPRISDVLKRIELLPQEVAESVGAVVAYGRMRDPRTGRTKPAVPRSDSDDLVEVDAAAWGASLVRCDVVRRGVLPDADMFFGFEDFDFWYSMQRAGYRMLLDVPTSRVVAERVFHQRREKALVDERPIDAEEPWRRYYEARNFLLLRRRYGHAGWTRSHVLLTGRRAQKSPSWAHRIAGFHGLVDGLRGRTGRHERYVRSVGEREQSAVSEPTVLQVITDNDRRGGQVFATDLHRALVDRDLHVRTVALTSASTGEGLNHTVLGPSRRHLRTLLALRREIRQSAVVLAHGSTTLPMCALASFRLSTPVVYRQISEQLFWANTRGRRIRTRLALGRTQRVVALWSGAADVLTREFGLDAERVVVIPNGVPAERCPRVGSAERSAARERFGLGSATRVLLSIGALVPEKGTDIVISAMADPLLDDWQLLVIGAGPQEAALRALASKLPSDRVRFHGPVGSAAEAIAATDVIGLASRGGDSMPAVLIEAGLSGIPAVATPVEGIVDIVVDGVTGRIVPKDDPHAFARAVQQVGAARSDFGESARAHCLAHFEINEVADSWHAIVRDVIDGEST